MFLYGQVLGHVQDQAVFDSWLGQHLTAPLRFHQRKPRPFFLKSYQEQAVHKYDEEDDEDDDEVDDLVDLDDEQDDDDDMMEDEDDGLPPLYLREEFRVASHRTFDTVDEIISLLVQFKGILNSWFYLLRW